MNSKEIKAVCFSTFVSMLYVLAFVIDHVLLLFSVSFLKLLLVTQLTLQQVGY